jgi:hypothetical protein
VVAVGRWAGAGSSGWGAWVSCVRMERQRVRARVCVGWFGVRRDDWWGDRGNQQGASSGRARAAAARSTLTVCVRAWWCMGAVGFVVGGGGVFVLLLCGLCWRCWPWAGVGGGGHITARVGWCVARGAAASWRLLCSSALMGGGRVAPTTWRGGGVQHHQPVRREPWDGGGCVRIRLRAGGRAGVRAWSGEWCWLCVHWVGVEGAGRRVI